MMIYINFKCILGQMPFHDCSHHTKKLCIVKNISLRKIYSSDVIAISLERIRKGNREREGQRKRETIFHIREHLFVSTILVGLSFN